MKLIVRFPFLLALSLFVPVGNEAAAQAPPTPAANVGDNANIIPLYKSGATPAPDDYLRGNLLGQRCNEPSIGISSINPNHMIVFCNDYRATFNWDDALVPSGKTTLVASVWNGFTGFLARMTGRPVHEKAAPKIIASAEAGVGGGVSYDGGTTWQGFMVPGGATDNSPASLAHPGKQIGLQGYSDPVAIRMKDGRVGVAYIGFTRDKVTGQSNQSGIFFTRYRDRNASDVEHDWEYEFSSQVALSNNLTQGQFLDKVSAAVGRDGVVWIAYTRFTGSNSSSNIFLAKSVDGGGTWSSEAIDKDAKYGQGTVILASPIDATKIGVLWRTFVGSTLLFKQYGKGTKNVNLFANDPDGPYLPFDQYPQPINSDPARVAFRALAFPAAAYTPDGSKIVVLFTEWIDLLDGKPRTTAAAGSPGLLPMVVMKVSADGGATWSARHVLNWKNGEKAGVPASPQRLGFFSPTPRSVGAQLMPAVDCSAGNQCVVVWKQDYGDLRMNPGGAENPGWYVTSGLNRRFDVRGAIVALSGSTPIVSGSFQVSRYEYKELNGTEKPGDISDTNEWVARMTLPNGTSYPMFDWANRNHTGAGKLAFGGDYLSVAAVPGDDKAFMVAFADNRYNIWPWQTGTGELVPPGDEWKYYPVFMAPGDPENKIPGVSCVNYGSRVQSVMVAKVSTSPILLTAQTNQKPFTGARPVCGSAADTLCIEFPLNIRNNTGQDLTVDLRVQGPVSKPPSFAKRPFDATADPQPPYEYPLGTGRVTIYPYSSYSLNAYAFDGSAITVTATDAATLATSRLTLNDPAVVGASAGSNFEYVPSTVNLASGSPRSGSPRSGSPRSGSPRSGSPRSYPVPEDPVPGETVYDVIDYTYVVSPDSPDDAGTYLSLFNIDPAYEGSYVFQVFVTKPLTSFTTETDDAGNPCSAFNWTEGALVGHISDPANPLVSGSPRSGSPRSGSPRSAIPSEGDPLVQNTSFTLGSSTEIASIANGAVSPTMLVSASGASDHCRLDECTKAAPRLPNEVTVLVRAYQIKPTAEITGSGRPLYDPDGSRTNTPTPPSVVVAEYSCDDPSCTAALGPDLAVQQTPAPAPSIVPNTRVRAGGQVTFPTVPITNEGIDGQCGTAEVPRSCGEAGAHKWAVYASEEADFSKVPRHQGDPGFVSGTVKENTDLTKGTITVLLNPAQPDLKWTGEHDKLGVGAAESAVVGSLTLPASLPRRNADGTGRFYLHFYDDNTRIVNELDETNNHWTEGPIIVEAPGFGFLGLQTPCSGFTCNKSGTIVLPWQFTNGSVAVDSVSSLPRLKFYQGCPVPTPTPPSSYLPPGDSQSLLLTSDPNPTDLTSGNSGWQYFPNTGMTRPQYTWQYNFSSSAGLAVGSCYAMYIEIPATGQVIGSTDSALKPFGPFHITPR